MYRILIALTKLLAPMIVFTADETWQHVQHKPEIEHDESVHMTLFPTPSGNQVSDGQKEEWAREAVHEFARGGLHESFKGLLWQWAGEKRRTVGRGANQYVHETALDRFGYRGYPTNPAFDFNALPVWPRDSFEKDFAWSQTAPPPPSPPLPGRKPGLCGKLVQWLEGS